MQFKLPTFGRRSVDHIAGLRDQIIEIGTHVRFLEADRLVPQPRDEGGRFTSKRALVRKALSEAVCHLTPEQRVAAKVRAESGQGVGR